MRGPKLAGLIITVYVLSHLCAFLAGPRAASYVHDLAFSYSAILFGVLIGAVGVFLAGIATTTQLVRGRATTADDAEAIIRAIRRASQELRSNVLFALAMVGSQGLVELLRIIDIPYVVWPIDAHAFTKTDVLNAVGISAAVLEFIAVVDCVRAMFTLAALSDEVGSPARDSNAPHSRRN